MPISLQFVQCLANPMYLHELCTQKYLDKPEFLNYLKYLEYWREPVYVRFIVSVFISSCAFRAERGEAWLMRTDGVDTRHVWST